MSLELGILAFILSLLRGSSSTTPGGGATPALPPDMQVAQGGLKPVPIYTAPPPQAPSPGPFGPGYLVPQVLPGLGQAPPTPPPPVAPIPVPLASSTGPVAQSISKSALVARGILGASGMTVGTFLTIDPSLAVVWGLAPGGYLITP